MHRGFIPLLKGATAQLLSGRPSRAALIASSLASPPTPYPRAAMELVHCASSIEFGVVVQPGTLGEACHAFQCDNRLVPITIDLPQGADPGSILVARRLLLHDILHVLLNFSADWPGQLGVFSFVAAQRYCPQFEQAARSLAQLCTTLAPWLRDELGEAERLGRQCAQAAPSLLTMPIEDAWREPLISLRVRLNLGKACALRGIDVQEPEQRRVGVGRV